jgi:LPS export ABC transporter protein LptC
MRRILFFLLSLLLFSFFFLILKSEKASEPNIELTGASFIEGLKIINRKNGDNHWILTARRADITENGSKAFLTDIEMSIIGKGISLRADKGLYDLNSKRLTVNGKVIATSDSYSIITDQVELDSNSHRLKSSGNVKIEGQKFSLEGSGMRIDETESKVQILNDVKATFSSD